jgi:uncharacterized protein YbjT (DUF2867 family)
MDISARAISLAVRQMQLGLGPASEQAFLRGVWSSSSSLSFCGRNSLGNAFQAARPSCGAVVCIAHDGEPGGSDREHDAVATVLIIGASRGIGLEAVKAALEAGHSVRALARSARRIPIDHPKLEKMAGDALEMATVKRAVTRVDVVTQSLGVSAGPEVILKPTRFFSKATRVLVTAMEEAQVKRLICVTGFGAGDSHGRGGFLYNVAFHLLLGRVYDDKDVQERIVRSSKLDWVIVRPVILTDGPKTNAYRALVDPRRWTCGFISRADVADFLVKQIDDDAFLHKTPVLTT